ncbi:hypothetical protein M422DRAFT_26464 [Sphaerobolus stellatus SS14]|nr:hypothetical protein M422DRAFT_26464 [Sphaerobolus stellatus SS14]
MMETYRVSWGLILWLSYDCAWAFWVEGRSDDRPGSRTSDVDLALICVKICLMRIFQDTPVSSRFDNRRDLAVAKVFQWTCITIATKYGR